MGKKQLSYNFNIVSALFIAFILFYGLQAIISLFYENSPPLIDFLIVLAILSSAFILHLKFKFKKAVPIGIGLGFIFHIAGLYKFIPYNPYYIGTLYGAPQLSYHYDWIVHSIGFAFFVIAFCSMSYPYFKRAFKSKLTIFFIILFFMLGFGAFNEILEYAGYTVFGYGQGFLEFGEGDSSPESGPWENSSRDLICNLIGGIVAAALFLLATRQKERKNKKLRRILQRQ